MIESLQQRGHQRMIGSAQAAAQSKPGLQCSGESGIKEIVLPWKAPFLGGILLGSVAQNRAFLLPARSQPQKDNPQCHRYRRLAGKMPNSRSMRDFRFARQPPSTGETRAAVGE